MDEVEVHRGLKLETRAYGDPLAAPTLVVWGHGLCNSLVGEDVEKLWNFWATAATAGEEGAGVAVDADGGGRHGGAASRGAVLKEDEGGAAAMHVVRYAARGHGNSSPADSPTDCTWKTLGEDMLALARRFRRGPDQKLVLGGASMGSASAIYAAVHAFKDAAFPLADVGSEPESESEYESEISGLVLVILPTFYDTRLRRKGQIMRATERGFAVTAKRKGVRPIFRGTPRELEPPQPLGVREDSFECVMRGGAESDLPPPDMVEAAVAGIPTLVLSWDCGDATHPASSAATFRADMAPHARVHIARSLQDTAAWPDVIRDFVAGL